MVMLAATSLGLKVAVTSIVKTEKEIVCSIVDFIIR